MLGMVAVLWLNYQREVPLDTVLYRNILGMYGVFIGMFLVQALVTAIVNKFLVVGLNMENVYSHFPYKFW